MAGNRPDGRVLSNMNTPADYDEARAWWEAPARDNLKRPSRRENAEPTLAGVINKFSSV